MSVSLSIVVPSVKSWSHAQPAVEALREQALACGAEIILAAAHPEGLPESCEPPVVGLRVPGGDVFALRAAAVASARGEIVALLEDHCYGDSDWCARLLATWRRHPEADGLLGVVENGAPGVLDEASFLLTWAPFLGPLDAVPTDRCPPPGIISYRRRVLPDTPPPLGWLEYELPVQLRESGRLVVEDGHSVTHIQHLGVRAFWLQYHAGRGYRGLQVHRASELPRRRQLAEALGMTSLLRRQTLDAIATRPGRPLPLSVRAVVTAFSACNAAGQVVGILSRSPGGSLSYLE